MDAGKMKDKITVEIKSDAPPKSAYDEPGYIPHKTVWCQWIVVNSVEALKSDAPQATIYAKARLRKLAGLSPTSRVIKGKETWKVIGDVKEIDINYVEIALERTVAG